MQFFILMCVALETSPRAFAAVSEAADQQVEKVVRQLILKKHPGTRVEWAGILSGSEKVPDTIREVEILGEGQNGELALKISGDFKEIHAQAQESGAEEKSEMPSREGVARVIGKVRVWLEVPSAKRRILPGEKLSNELFEAREVNISSGMEKEIRGLILPVETDFSRLEARQTILEGMYPLFNGVQKIPDIRRGQPIKLRIISGGLSVVTPGQAQESASVGETLRATTQKSKKDMMGTVTEDGYVEVVL